VTPVRGFPAFPPRPGRRGRSWWAREFVIAMEDAALDLVMLRRGRRFAASGRVGPIAVSPGRIAATVDDTDGAFDVVLHVGELDGAAWDRFLAQVVAESGHLVALLDGEVPRSLVQAADAAGVALLPSVGDLESECGCPDIGDPCLHAAALCYQAAWLLDDDPLVLLLLRGRDRDELLDALGAVRPPDVDVPVPAAAAYAVPTATLPELDRPPAGRIRRDLPPPPGLPADLVATRTTWAAARARALLAPHGVTSAR